jgi:hypothetical protein
VPPRSTLPPRNPPGQPTDSVRRGPTAGLRSPVDDPPPGPGSTAELRPRDVHTTRSPKGPRISAATSVRREAGALISQSPVSRRTGRFGIVFTQDVNALAHAGSGQPLGRIQVTRATTGGEVHDKLLSSEN